METVTRQGNAPKTRAKKIPRDSGLAKAPYEKVILRQERRRRPDNLNFTVYVRPIGATDQYQEFVVARMFDMRDAATYGQLLANRANCPFRAYT